MFSFLYLNVLNSYKRSGSHASFMLLQRTISVRKGRAWWSTYPAHLLKPQRGTDKSLQGCQGSVMVLFCIVLLQSGYILSFQTSTIFTFVSPCVAFPKPTAHDPICCSAQFLLLNRMPPIQCFRVSFMMMNDFFFSFSLFSLPLTGPSPLPLQNSSF